MPDLENEAPDDGPAPDVGPRPGGGSRSRWRRPNATERSGKRRHRVEIKLTDAEYVKVRAAAAVQRCSMPAVYTRAFAADGSMAALHYQFLRDDLSSARRLMVQVSNNLNQAVRLAHIHQMEGTESPRQFEADLRAVADRLDDVIAAVTQVVDRVDDVDVDEDLADEAELAVEDGAGSGEPA